MKFEALLVSTDADTIAALIPALSGFDVAVEACAHEDAPSHLSGKKLDAVLVDFDEPQSAVQILQATTQSPRRQIVTLALLSDKTKLRSVFAAGANFVLYKPVSPEQAVASFRAALALMQRERRRSFRVPIQLPVQLRLPGNTLVEGILLDVSETGMDVLGAQALYPSTTVMVHLTLPGETQPMELQGEVAWANPNGQSGVRFTHISELHREHLQKWLTANAPHVPPDNPAPLSQCKLTDLSPGACYVETESPFPEGSGISLFLTAGETQLRIDGMVRVMHPESGMGVELTSDEGARERVSAFIAFLSGHDGMQPVLEITPRMLAVESDAQCANDLEDPLLDLLRRHESLSQQEFLANLQSQRQHQPVGTMS
jgi:CheY-like chemotaxis protein